MMKNKRGQIWVETVLYTLIGLAIIAALLAIVRPAIQEKQDQIILEQSLIMINDIDSKIEDVRYYGVGNSRQILVEIKKGELIIDTENDTIAFSMESRHEYSESGEDVEIGRVTARTEEKGNVYDVALILDYLDRVDLTWNGGDREQKFQRAPTPHKISLTNNGANDAGLLQIDFSSV